MMANEVNIQKINMQSGQLVSGFYSDLNTNFNTIIKQLLDGMYTYNHRVKFHDDQNQEVSSNVITFGTSDVSSAQLETPKKGDIYIKYPVDN